MPVLSPAPPPNDSERLDTDRLRFAIEGANEGLWDWDIPSGLMYLSPRYEEILGYAPGECDPRYEAWERDLHPDDRDRTLELLEDLVERRAASFAAEYRIRTKSGAWVWVSDRAKVATWNDAGKAVRAVGTLADITERKRVEQALRERDEQLRLALRSAEAGAWFLDMIEDRLVWSEEVYRIYGVDPQRERASKEVWLSRIHPEERPHVEAMSEDILRERRREYQTEFRILHPRTGTRWLLARGQVNYDERGRPIRMSGLTVDITERKLAEIALEEAKHQAEIASRAKSEFLATMSHELRTPLNAIIGFAELIKDEMFGPLGAECYRRYASDIHASGLHLLELVNDILDLSKIEAGRLDLSPKSVALRPVIEGCLALMRPHADANGLTLVADFAPDQPAVWADELRLRQILLNLLSNAVKFTPSGGNVRVAVRREGGAMVIEVADTGIGMGPHEIDIALEPFRQIESTLSRRHGGTGLGLPLAKRLTELQDGRLEIESAPGAGTTVTILLPRVAPGVARLRAGD